MKKGLKRTSVISILLCVIWMTALPSFAAVKLNRTTAVVTAGFTVKLKVKGTGKKVSWKSSNTKVAAVSKKGIVKAKKKGNAIITAVVDGRGYLCQIQVLPNEFWGVTGHGDAAVADDKTAYYVKKLQYSGKKLVTDGFFRTGAEEIPAGTSVKVTLSDQKNRVLSSGLFNLEKAVPAGSYLDRKIVFSKKMLGKMFKTGKKDLRVIKNVRAEIELSAEQEEEIEVEKEVEMENETASDTFDSGNDEDVPDLGLIDGGDTSVSRSNSTSSSGGTLPSSGKKTVKVKKTVKKTVRVKTRKNVANRIKAKAFKKIKKTIKISKKKISKKKK